MTARTEFTSADAANELAALRLEVQALTTSYRTLRADYGQLQSEMEILVHYRHARGEYAAALSERLAHLERMEAEQVARNLTQREVNDDHRRRLARLEQKEQGDA